MAILSSFRFKVAHASIFALFLIANFFKWLIFGELTSHEIKTLREKAGYTAWEFVFGFSVFYNSTSNLSDLSKESTKFAALFLCVWLVKCFHYITADRVHSTYSGAAGGTGKFIVLRLGLGVFCLNLIDGLLIYKYLYDVILQNYVRHNVLISLFGFDIMNHFPMILSTTLQYLLNSYEILCVPATSEASLKNWKVKKVRTMFVAEFVFNLLRVGMSFVFSLIFLYYYTFPVHMFPTAYNSLKMAVLKTRLFVDFKKRELKLLKLAKPTKLAVVESCIICYEELENSATNEIVSVPSCHHTFHYECIQLWIDYLATCPICREKL